MSLVQSPDLVEHVSPLAFDATLDRLVRAIINRGMTIFARIDHAANARAAGMAMPAATVLVYGAAKGGTPIMLATPAAALDLPLHVLVRAGAGGKTVVAFHPIGKLLQRAGVPTDAVGRLEPAQQLLVAALSA